MPVPRIAIVGRPNVGKSSLLNMLARDKVSIVDDTPGTTRDRVSILTDLPPPGQGDDSPDVITVEVTDTGGYGVYVVEGRRYDEVGADLASLTDDIERQIALAVESAQIVLFVIDAQAGITAHDQTIARLLRERVLGRKPQRGKGGPGTGVEVADGAPASESGHEVPLSGQAESGRAFTEPPRVLIVANKCDGPRWEAHAYEAAALGFGEPLPVSAKSNYFRRDFIDRLYETLERIPGVVKGQIKDDPATTGVKLAIIGKRNAGKSSLVNALAGAKRVIVSEIAGTTRDAVDVRFEMDGKVFTAIDTAGLRKKKSFADRIEWWAFDRASRAIERADVVLMLIDATLPPSQVDQQLAQLVRKSHKPAILVVNKWDLVEGKAATAGRNRGKPITPQMYEEYLREEVKALANAPISFVSAKNVTNIQATVRLALELHEQAGQRVGTGKLNRLLRHILETRGPSSKLGTFAKVYFAAQVRTHPPTIVLVVNRPELFIHNYQKFLLNQMRKHLPFPEVPINLIIKGRKTATKLHELVPEGEFVPGAARGGSDRALEEWSGDDETLARQAFEELGVDLGETLQSFDEAEKSGDGDEELEEGGRGEDFGGDAPPLELGDEDDSESKADSREHGGALPDEAEPRRKPERVTGGGEKPAPKAAAVTSRVKSAVGNKSKTIARNAKKARVKATVKPKAKSAGKTKPKAASKAKAVSKSKAAGKKAAPSKKPAAKKTAKARKKK